jgi:hypothetical protein
MLVPVQFPGDLGIPHFLEIEIVDFEPRLAGRAFAVNDVGVPVDLRAVIEIFIAQQVETVPANLFCLRKDVLCLGRKGFFKQSAKRRNFIRREKKVACLRRG